MIPKPSIEDSRKERQESRVSGRGKKLLPLADLMRDMR